MKKNKISEELIYDYTNKSELTDTERKDFFYHLTLLDWNNIAKDYGESFNDKILKKIMNEKIEDLETMSNAILLYNNPYGIYTLEFGKLITKFYLKDKIKFIKALNLVKDETINIVYVFRLERIFPDDYTEDDSAEIQASNMLTDEEKETARMFFKMYRNICISCL